MEKVCENCKATFKVKPSKILKTKFCTKICRLDFYDKNYKERLLQRFLNKVIKLENGCWIWTGNLNKDGYGYLTVMRPKKHKAMAMRVSLWIFTGEEDRPGEHVCHTCHNNICVNPKHLHFGTAAENISEMVGANRQAKGTGLPQHKLTESEVLEIRRLFASGKNCAEIAKLFNVTWENIKSIIVRHTWKHI